jgi:hypothetical protein
MSSGYKRLLALLFRSAMVAVVLAGTGTGGAKAEDKGSKEPGGAKKETAKPTVAGPVLVFGKVVDDATGEPIVGFIEQAGHFDPKDPAKVTWGYSEKRNSSTNSFDAQIRWSEGWTARIVADGYVPQPVITEAPDREKIEKVIRMKKGRAIRGRVLDHLGKPVQGASVIAARPHGMTLAGGAAVNSFDGAPDETVRAVKTDAEGRFELSLSIPAEPKGDAPKEAAVDAPPAKSKAPAFAISTPNLDAWPVALPEGNEEAVIRLPEPGHVDIRYDIEGSDDEATIFVQSVMHELEAWKGFEIIRHIKVDNKGHVELNSLPPGRYQFARSRMLRHGNIGQGGFLDRQFVDLVEGKPTEVSFVRTTGARLSGSVSWDEEFKLTGVILSVRKVPPADASATDRLFPELLDTRLLRVGVVDTREKNDSPQKLEITGNRGLFLTERIPPGTYELYAEGYAPLTPAQERRTGLIRPVITAHATVTVPETGAVPSIKLELKKEK